MQYAAPTACIVNAKPSVARLVATAPLRTIRTSDRAEVYAYPRGEARARTPRASAPAHARLLLLGAGGARPRVVGADARGGHRRHRTAIYGDRVPVLTGLAAGRVQQVLPRALGVASWPCRPNLDRQRVDRAGQGPLRHSCRPRSGCRSRRDRPGPGAATTPRRGRRRRRGHRRTVGRRRPGGSWPTSPGAGGCRRRASG